MDIKNSVKTYVKKIGLSYPQIQCKREYKSQQFCGINERPIEYSFVFGQLTQLWPRTVLDVGTGTTALPHLMRNCGFLVTAVDNIRDYWPNGMINRHYHVINDDITDTRLHQRFDVITCVSVLEHIKEYRAAVKSMFSLLNPGGQMVLTFPYNERQYIGNVYELPDSSVDMELPFITQSFSRKEIDTWLVDTGMRIQEQEYWQFFSGEYWTCGTRICPPVRVDRESRHQVCCLSLVKSDGTVRPGSAP
jgi:SAM-dependent methyltransferase